MKKLIGILGLGDLGSQLATQIAAAGFDVVAFDSDKTKVVKNKKVRMAVSEMEVLDTCSIVHWAIPSKLLTSLKNDLRDIIVILHDSVMDNSLSALGARNDASKFVIVHCLMNKAKRVFIASNNPRSKDIAQHFQLIGLSPKLTSINEHDTLMARSQGILATLIALGLRNELDEASQNGDLTPSADELHRVLMNRELNWTSSTLKSILANPELSHVAERMLVTVNKREDNKG